MKEWGYVAFPTKFYRKLTWPSELSSLWTSCSLAPAANCSDSRTIRSKIVLTIWRMVAAAVLFVVAFFVKCSRKQMTTAWAKARPCKIHTRTKTENLFSRLVVNRFSCRLYDSILSAENKNKHFDIKISFTAMLSWRSRLFYHKKLLILLISRACQQFFNISRRDESAFQLKANFVAKNV